MTYFYSDLHIHTSEDANSTNKVYDVAKLKTKVELMAKNHEYLIWLTDHNTINEEAYINMLKLNIYFIVGVELHIKNYDGAPAYHYHFYFDLGVFDDPNKLRTLNEDRNRARMVAGYCCDWNVKHNRGEWDVMLPPDFKAKWNLEEKAMYWAIDPQSFEEVGCIYTCQGLEYDYVGVFIGKDLVYRDGKVCTNKTAISKDDKTSKIRLAPDDLADQLIENKYKVLLTRGQKECFIYCKDDALREYLKNKSV